MVKNDSTKLKLEACAICTAGQSQIDLHKCKHCEMKVCNSCYVRNKNLCFDCEDKLGL